MTDTMARQTDATMDLSTPIPIVSADSHISPRLADLRSYCPADRLDDYDAFADAYEKSIEGVVAGMRSDVPASEAQNLIAAQRQRVGLTDGAHDVAARLRDMDRDGIATEVVFHGTQDLNPVPFVGIGGSVDYRGSALELSYAGLQIYNRWLADACVSASGRLIGCAHLPLWDVEESVRELERARDGGLRAVNFPAPRRGLAFYDDPVWEPFWSECEDLGMVLATHAGAIDRDDIATPGRHEIFLRMIEAGGWPARRALPRLIFSGVFERHPGLKLVLTEQNYEWWNETVREFDSAYRSNGWQIADLVPKLPSEYLRANVFIGASFMAPFEAAAAVRDDYVANVMWGRDYPHVEGTWQYQEPDDPENMTRLSLRYAYSGIDPRHVKAMLSENGVRVFDLDPAPLRDIADRIGAPTLQELSQPIGELPGPGRGGVLSFRQIGPWG